MSELSEAFTSFSDERGTLVPVELGAVAFEVRRVFTVVGSGDPRSRGDHRLRCRELIVLVSGEVRVEVGAGPDGPFERRVLGRPGESLEVASGTWLRYHLRDERSVILVLASAPYVPPGEP